MTAVLCALALPLAANVAGGGNMTATASPDSLERTKGGKTSSSQVATAEPAVASVAGGMAPYTYLWSLVDGDTITITSPTSASTYFSATVPADSTKSATFICTVTDALGAHVPTNEVSVSLSAISFSGGALL